MNSETTAILGAQSSVTVIVQQGQVSPTTTVAVKPAPHNIVMADMFSLKKRDYFDAEDYKPQLHGHVSREEYKEVIGEVNALYSYATDISA